MGAPEFKEIINTSASSRRVILPDGSIVQMSSQSSIGFLNSNEKTSRELFLKGEAYFDIAHDPSRPFYVYAGDVITKVLGTSFIIRAPVANEKVTVSVKTGKVTVYSKKNSHKKTVLTPNQEAVYDHSTDLVATQEIPAARLKEENRNFIEMEFEETPVSEVLALLTERYDIDIEFNKDDLSGCVITSSFLEEGLYDRIDVICTAIGATYGIVDARIIIESKGCNLKPD
jgi:ferric-dicitrate binding protein FerR (iron transport regulator)